MRDYLDEHMRLRRSPAATVASLRPFLVALLLIMLTLLLLVLDRAGFLGATRGIAQQVLRPIAAQAMTLRNGIVHNWPTWGELEQLRTENAALKLRTSQLAAEVMRLQQAAIENIHLRQQLVIESERPWHLLGAEVVMHSPDAGRRVLTIARGSTDGLALGMAVIGQAGDNPAALVGMIETVGPHTADVLLITDFSSQMSARVLRDDGATIGIVQGQWQRGSRLRLEGLERGNALVPGDAVVTAGLSGALQLPLNSALVPPGIPIGSVEVVGKNGATTTAELRPFVDPDQVYYVWVITGV